MESGGGGRTPPPPNRCARDAGTTRISERLVAAALVTQVGPDSALTGHLGSAKLPSRRPFVVGRPRWARQCGSHRAMVEPIASYAGSASPDTLVREALLP